MKRSLVVAALALAGLPVAAANKCAIDGRTVYQEAPCAEAGETVAQGLQRRERTEAWHRKLDQLQARGVGLVQREAPPLPPPRSADDEPPLRLGRRRPTPADRAAENARLTVQTQRQNAASLQVLSARLEADAAACGGKLHPLPWLGMRDETFRLCTVHARFGGVQQIVAFEEDGVPMRLYVFGRGEAERVYSVGGVITAIRP